ncbi:CHAT domain-containing protein [Streptosporangium sp. NPDC048865]|uniref:CHAT domain-containing protein n=1 Tax=Streptosporangium sp. NPDC048865 TaxID=3155766 RepID=UPI00341440AE
MGQYTDRIRRVFYRAVKPRLLRSFFGWWPDEEAAAFRNVGERLEDVFVGLGDLEGLLPVLRRMREVFGDARVPGELSALARMVVVKVVDRDHAAVAVIAGELAGLAASGSAEQAVAETSARLGLMARAAHHEGAAEQAALLAETALALNPEEPSALFALAYGAARRGRFEESLGHFDRLIAADPGRAGPYEGRSAVLARLGRDEEAIEAIGAAIVRDPHQPRHRLVRARRLTERRRYVEALEDLTVCVSQAAAEAAVLAADPRAGLPYLDTVPTAQLIHEAVVTRLVLLDALDRRDDAVLCAFEALVDPRLPGIGPVVEEWTGRGPSPAEILATGVHGNTLRLARCLTVLDEVDRALPVIEEMRLRPYDMEAFEATPGLLELLAVRHPDDPGVRRLLADVLLVRWRPRAALDHLHVLLTLSPGDWYGLLLRGMARVTHAEGDPGWTEEIAVLPALEDLVGAVRAAPEGERRALNALRWLFQLTMAVTDLRLPLMILVTEGEEPYRGVLDAFPGLDSVVARLMMYETELSPRQALTESDELLGTAREEAVAAGLGVLAALIDLMRADVVLRLPDVQRAMDHLGAAEAVIAFLGTIPNIEYLPSWTHGDFDDEREQADVRGVLPRVVDFDHQEVMMTALVDLDNYADLLHAEIDVRLGDPGRALERLASQEPSRPARLLLARILRDAGRHGEAREMLEGLEDDSRAVTTEAAILRLQGDHVGGARVLTGLLDRDDLDPGERVVIAGNLADALSTAGDPADGLAVLDANPPAPGAQPSVRITWAHARGRVLGALGRPEEALADLLEALDLKDRVRGGLRAEADRIGWQAENLPLLQYALAQAVAAGRFDTALELVERGRARAFVDGLDLGHPLYGPEAARLAGSVAAARERRRLLLSLAADPRADSPAVERLRELGTDLRADETRETLGERVAREITVEGPALRRLEQRLLRSALGGRASLAGRVSSAGEVRAMLGPAVLLAEFVALEPGLVGLLAVTRDGIAWSTWPAEALEELSRHLQSVSQPGDVLCLVPSGPLHDVPPHALAVDGEPLMARNPVCRLPSASVLALCRTRRGESGGRPFSALVLGDSRGDLRHAGTEARVVADLLGARPLIGTDATRDLLGDGADAHDVIHIACHAFFDQDNPEQSGILLADAQLTVEDVYDLRLDARLVVLSACESGRSQERPGDELMGLVRAFMYAGVSSLVVSRHPVDDLSAALIMGEFYPRWRSGAGPAAALAGAQLAIRDLTCAEAIRRVRSWPADDSLGTRLAVAGLRARAGDLAAAIALYEDLLAEPDAPADLILRRLTLLRFRAEAPVTADYGWRPFADPRHWGAFMLVGDWRTE